MDDHILTSLKVISMIKEGQKVCIRNGVLTLETHSSGIWTSIKRWIHRDSRVATVCYMRNIIHSAIALLHTKPEIRKGLQASLAGMNSLIVTYNEDATISAMLQILRDRVTLELNNIDKSK